MSRIPYHEMTDEEQDAELERLTAEPEKHPLNRKAEELASKVQWTKFQHYGASPIQKLAGGWGLTFGNSEAKDLACEVLDMTPQEALMTILKETGPDTWLEDDPIEAAKDLLLTYQAVLR